MDYFKKCSKCGRYMAPNLQSKLGFSGGTIRKGAITMTENEAIKVLVTQKQCIDKSSSGQCKINCGDCKKKIFRLHIKKNPMKWQLLPSKKSNSTGKSERLKKSGR